MTTTATRKPGTDSVKGDRVEFDYLLRYNGYDRDYASKGLPLCTYRHSVGTVVEVIAWADNSTDVRVLTDEGDTVTEQVSGPSGDICY